MIAEPSTLLSDYALAALTAALAGRLRSRARASGQRAVRLWSLAFAAAALGSFLGGTYHGFAPALGPRVAAATWTATTIAVALGSSLLLAAAVTSAFRGARRQRLLAVVGLAFLAYTAWLLRHDDFRWVIAQYASSLGLVVLVLSTTRSRQPRAFVWVAAGVVVSAAAAAVQQSGFDLHRHFNHNDIQHVIQMGGIALLYRGGAALSDARDELPRGGRAGMPDEPIPRFSSFVPCSAGLSLAEVLARLERRPDVLGVALLGSTAEHPAAWSDYDLLIIVAGGPELDVEFTYVDGRPTDVVLVEAQTLGRLVSAEEPRSKRDADVGRWLAAAQIAFSRAPDLDALRRAAPAFERTTGVSERELFFRWVEANFNLRKCRRYLEADTEPYRSALELQVASGLSAVLADYLHFRRLPWQGEKAAVELLRLRDPGFLELLQSALRTTDLPEKTRRYGALVARACEPVGGVWAPGETAGGWTLPEVEPRRHSRWERLMTADAPGERDG